MTADSNILDGKGRGHRAAVSEYNQLIVSPAGFSEFYNATAGTDATAANLVGPIAGKRFVITAIVLYANKNVGASDATVTLYEATGPTVTTVSKTLLLQEMVQKTSLVIPGLNVIVTAGAWVNLKTDDDDVFCNMAGYYVEQPPS